MGFITRNVKHIAEYGDLIQAAGYRTPTLLQQLILPPIIEGRDVSIESGVHSGKTLSIAIGIILKGARVKPGISTLVLTNEREQAAKLLKAFTRSLSAFHQGLSVVSIGFSDLVKKEARQFTEKADIIVGTPSRVIDHIRRGNVDITGVKMVFIDEAETDEQEFENDVCYILSKVKAVPQIIRFCPPRERSYHNIEQLLKRPVVIQERDFSVKHGGIAYSYLCVENKEEFLLRLLLSLDFESVVLVVDSVVLGKKIAADLKTFYLDGILLHKETNQAKVEKAIEIASYEHLDFIITPRDTLPLLHFESVSHVVFYDMPAQETGFHKAISPSQVGETEIQCLVLTTSENEKQILSLQEQENVKMKKMNLPTNDEIIKASVERFFRNANSTQNVSELKQFNAAVKRAVPFGKRSHFIAYLLRESLQKVLARKIELTTLFVNIGRTRDVTAKDISLLFMNTLSIDKSSMGDVRVFDNYSFVEIDSEYADKAIATLSETELKGKKLIVNYSRKKPEKRRFGTRRNKRD